MIQGIDVSDWQGTINWSAVAGSGVRFAGIKATEGAQGVDPFFARNWEGAKAAGLVRIAYGFTRPENGYGQAQALHLADTVGTWGPGDLAAGDFETPEGGSDESSFMLEFLGALAGRCGFAPLVYCTEDWALNRARDPRLAAYPLWLACLDPSQLPARIGVWPSVALQQHSWTLHIPGIGGDVDGDRLERSVAGLKALGKPAPFVSKRWCANRKFGLLRAAAHGMPAVAIVPSGVWGSTLAGVKKDSAGQIWQEAVVKLDLVPGKPAVTYSGWFPQEYATYS